jgi:2-polyprenyl-6-hydroxyphenyl methylase / 3-demethylubiquinone-9 3-methyltransferase
MDPFSTRPQAAAGAGTAASDEIARFDAIAEDWWDPEGDFRPLHRLNPVRVGYVRDALCRHFNRDPEGALPLQGLTLIDIGCGGGLVAEPLARLGARVTGIDASEEAIRIARAHAEREGLEISYRCAPPEALLAEEQRFDAVVALEVIEHVADLDQFFAATAALLRPGGAVALSTLNRTVKSLALAKIGAEYVMRWLPVGTHDWRKFVKPSEMAAALRRNGLGLVDLAGVTYDPLRGTWSLSTDLDVNYMGFAV